MNVRCFNPQFFISSRVGDAALESERKARAYEHRVEVLIEAVKVLAAAVPVDSLMPADQLVLEQLRALDRVPADEGYTSPQRIALRR
jgi:hypothetical protein